MAQRNCEAYGVSDKVTWVLGDVFKHPIDKVDAVFLSPPWGGPQGTGRPASMPPTLFQGWPGVCLQACALYQ